MAGKNREAVFLSEARAAQQFCPRSTCPDHGLKRASLVFWVELRRWVAEPSGYEHGELVAVIDNNSGADGIGVGRRRLC